MPLDEIGNWINGVACMAVSARTFTKLNPADGSALFAVARSDEEDIQKAVAAAKAASAAWAGMPAVRRGLILHDVVLAMQKNHKKIAGMVALETGKSPGDAVGETDAAIALGLFYASEGQRLYGKTCTSGIPGRQALTVRQPVGIAGLIIAANTPIANIAWKVFPALVCGNTAVLKAAEDTPGTASVFVRIARDAGLPVGVLNVVQGFGQEAGAPLVANPDIGVISFTGSAGVGRQIAEQAARRMAKVSLELGGKNPLVVCDDADMDNAVRWCLLSAFSNAGQRCVSASRIIVFAGAYDAFRDLFVTKTKGLKVGIRDGDFLGPVINERQLNSMIAEVRQAELEGAVVLTGGKRLLDREHAHGFFMEPTILENVSPDAAISDRELFGPITCLYRVNDFQEALHLVNRSSYGLSASIHTQNINRAMEFTRRAQVGVAVVNGGTHGSEPHMPFGGLKNSGNGSREPGTEALDIYTELKDIYYHLDPGKV